jgi:RHS repeat-associated protein
MSEASGTAEFAWTRRGEMASLTAVLSGRSYATAYSYDAAGRVATLTYPSGRELSFTRDAQGQVTSLKTRAGSGEPWMPVLEQITWQPFGPFSGAVLGSDLTLDHAFSADDELTAITLAQGASFLYQRSYARSDLINVTDIDAPGTADDQRFAYTPTNRLATADGPWGSEAYGYDLAGNRLRLDGTLEGASSLFGYSYDSLSNRISEVTLNGSSSRTFTNDAAGNIIADVRGANVYAYTYDAANRLSEVTRDGVLQASYLYNGFGQLTARTLTAATGLSGTVHYVYDGDGHLITEADAATGAILREYLWLDDLPVAVIDGATLYHVVTDHLYRPVAMLDDAGTEVWSAVWEPFGALYSVTGALNLDARFPGQWYQLETGLHYNWHRHYDPTLGRYTQPDPLGMPDGPNRYAYARNNPVMNIDPDGQQVALPMPGPGIPLPLPPVFIPGSPENDQFTKNTLGGLQKIIQMCRRSLGFGGGGNDDEPDCHSRQEREEDNCRKRRWQMAHNDYFQGCIQRSHERRSRCIRNGGKPSPDEPPEWGDADEETWIDPYK